MPNPHPFREGHRMRLSSSVGSGLMAVAASSALLLPACNNQTSTPGAASEALKTEHSAAATTEVAKAPTVLVKQDATLARISAAFQKFHTDTGGWPNGESVWFEDKAGQVDATEFTSNDTALFVKPASVPACSAEVTK